MTQTLIEKLQDELKRFHCRSCYPTAMDYEVNESAENILAILEEYKSTEQEPFGYFKAEPFGWTDCAETDEGAIALYEKPQ